MVKLERKKVEKSILEPLIISRADHPISRKNIDREALKVMYRLRDAGYTAYLVGGGVRDIYLGKKPKDFDISTNAKPGQLKKLFRNSRVIGKRFRLVQVFFRGDKIIEVSTFRRPSEYDLVAEDEVLPSNNSYGTPGDDAFRRDLTINALFYEIENFTIIDFIGGVQDLKDGIVRIVGDPGRRITRDPVRMMRAVRHAARSGFDIEEHTWQAIKEHRAKLSLCPVSRIRDELLRDLQGGASRKWAMLCKESGLLEILFPFCKGLPESSFHELFDLLGVADRLQGEGQRIPEYILLALVCLPWVKVKMDLMDKVRQGKESHLFTQLMRKELTENLQHFSIKRAVKEQMAGILATLPLFVHHGAKGSWPRWLARKSYFKTGQQFCSIYKEARGAGELAVLHLDHDFANEKKSSPEKRGKKRNRNPAFSKRSKGGIFGLKKR